MESPIPQKIKLPRKFVYIVVDDPPEESGESAFIALYDNRKSAIMHKTALRQENTFQNQYVTVWKRRLYS